LAYIALLVISVVCADWIIGLAMNKMLPSINRQGQNGITYYSLHEVSAPIVIVGSSRASHHYDCKIISDSMRCDVFNLGRDGCFFSYNCCVINSILNRYAPQTIVWETPFNAFEHSYDPMESLHPYYGRNQIATAYIDEDYKWNERLPLCSSLYKYNSNFLRIIYRYFKNNSSVVDDLNGYYPLPPKKWNPVPPHTTYSVNTPVVIQSKVDRFKSVVSHAKSRGVRLIVVDSPSFRSSGDEFLSADLMKSICDSMQVEMYNFRQAEGIFDQIEYFNDYDHLNTIGAEAYTKMFVERALH